MSQRRELESPIVSDLQVLSAVSGELGRAFGACHGLGVNDFAALMLIMVADADGAEITVGELRKRLGLSSAAMTYLVGRLTDSNYIRRDTYSLDRRIVLLRPDARGVEVAREFLGQLGARIRVQLADTSASDLAAAHRVFVAVIDSMGAHMEGLRVETTGPSL